VIQPRNIHTNGKNGKNGKTANGYVPMPEKTFHNKV
jgi:putative sigma-54 modulation protein